MNCSGPSTGHLNAGLINGRNLKCENRSRSSPCYYLRLLSLPPTLRATPTTFDVNNLTIGTGSVTGTIVTDGNTGTIGTSDILSYNLILTIPTQTTENVNSTVPGTFVSGDGSNLSETNTSLTYNFSGPTGFLDFFHTGTAEFCLFTNGECGLIPPPNNGMFIYTIGGSTTSNPFQTTGELSGVTVFATIASPTPEPATWSLILIGAGLLGLVVMRKRIARGLPQTT